MKNSLFLLFLSIFCLNGVAKSGADAKYISQELIDTSILRAFVILNASADLAGVGFGHQKSLGEAKKIAQELKTKAKGDPNERYVLWKVSELEAQIYLEERDLVLQQMQKRQLTINEVVDKYNKEVGKWRPDIGTLYRLHKTMDQVDPGKAGELADSYNKRKNALSREVVYFLEKALLAGNADSSRKELGYLLRNQMYLNVSATSYKQLEDRVEGLYRAREIAPSVTAGAKSASRLLDRMDIVEARKTLDTAQNKLTTIQKNLPQSESASLSSSISHVQRKLGAKEDSLVNVNVTLLRREGVDAADRYLQAVLRPYGVSREKAASVDRMIISAKSPEESHSPSLVAGLTSDDDDDGAETSQALDDVLTVARRKAQVKVDSLHAIEEARLWQERREQARRDSIEQVARAAEERKFQQRQMRVDSVTMKIYSMIERNDPVAADRILKSEVVFLQANMRPDDFSMLKTTIDQFAGFVMEKKKDIAYLSPVAAKTAPPSAAPSPAVVSQKAPAASAPPSQQVASAPSAQSNSDRAQEEVLGVYSLLEQNMIDRAYKRFQTNRSPLKKYLDPEVYRMLEMTVTQAYEFYTSAQQW